MLYKFSGPPQRDTEAFPVSPMSDSNRHSISRRDFMKAALVTPAAGFLQKIDSSKGSALPGYCEPLAPFRCGFFIP